VASMMGICPSGCLALLNLLHAEIVCFVYFAEINILLLLDS